MTSSELFNNEFDGNDFTLSGESVGVLLFHGFTATTLEVRNLGKCINQQLGWTVRAPLLPGHGTCPKDLSRTKYNEWVDCAETEFDLLKKNFTEIVVGGESMGGLIALYLAAKYSQIAAVLLYAPALVIPDMPVARFFHKFIYSTKKKNLVATKNGFLPWQGYRVNPLKAVVELGKLQTLIKPMLIDVRQPTLLFQGKQDETIDPKSSSIIYKSISSIEKHLEELDECGHCVLLDRQHEWVEKKTIDFIKQIIE
ncbi:alpha/beta hydrolase [Leptolinea tardivitalis]|uniref:AB hydrolase-1 domain-containing protein n=1 Tax=Leptolinea tardivitalis TaxID=229920 RepID=A0A0P6X1B0_9CHLR|nr:alpha/beta fold hydrolase [Leptolinea tardivitalis]KPL74675.1 hypothetical protein ADM99_00830 [Leptolinea tardivitalis]GAP22982.1 esterase [Leptolinea tardivitalis]